VVRDAWSLCPDPKQWIQVPVFPNEPLTKPFPLQSLQINVDSFLFINFFSPIASYYFLARVTRPVLSLDLSDHTQLISNVESSADTKVILCPVGVSSM
jgi:hypothetical protein